MRLIYLYLIAAFALLSPSSYAADTASSDGNAPPQQEKPADSPAAVSADFWDEWNKTKSSESYAAMKNAVGCADKNTVSLEAQHAAAKASKAPTKQTVVNMAIDRPEDAAALLNHAAESSKDKVSANALATVVNMVTSPKTREQAVPLMAPEAKPRVQEWAANLTTGIQGLPGIYLGDVQAPSYWSPEPPGGRSAMPSGYAPVSGGSFGCPTR